MNSAFPSCLLVNGRRIREGIDNNAGADKGAAEKHMASFARYLPDLRSGARLRLSYEQTHGLEVRYQEKLIGVEKDAGFAQLLFRVWLGPKPPDAKLKAGLLGGHCD
ncbi:MAG TPA: chalcone isomerase family protein [Polyangiales bacterium]|nr:chalcone isomerase family protein [Polyangiales bacterium]